jgi:hypothetical protein
MATLAYTATCAELLALSKAVRAAVCDKSGERRFTIVFDNAPGGGSTWSITDPAGNVKKG